MPRGRIEARGFGICALQRVTILKQTMTKGVNISKPHSRVN